MNFKLILWSVLFLFANNMSSIAQQGDNQTIDDGSSTFCNPLNLDYRFHIPDDVSASLDGNFESYREAADPMVILFKGDYYIFASKSGGYWWSPDFQSWTFVEPTGLDIEKYAPTVWQIEDTLYYTSSSSGDIYKTTDPKNGTWEYVSHPFDWNDPWVFVDDDGKVYAYYGSGENGPISCIQLDPKNKFATIGEQVLCINTNPAQNGYEVNGENNEGGSPWTEGAAMLKHNGTYYLTYSTPGTEKRSYCEAYYTSKSPMGPFTLGANSPSVRKSLGYVTGTGHGGLFFDKAGKLWNITCVSVAKKHWFERRLALFPAEIDDEGLLHTNTVFGDYPQYYPGVSSNPVSENSIGWNLLSKGKSVTVSSTFEANNANNAVDEDIRTCWSAATGNAGEWLMVDLGDNCIIIAIQSNFYEMNTTYAEGRETAFQTMYKIEYSTDNSTWIEFVDKSSSAKDTPHDYIELENAIDARFVRITNTGNVPGYGNFALSDFRIFGQSGTSLPNTVESVLVQRKNDQRVAAVSWETARNADGYIIRYGIAPDKLWNHYQIWNDNSYSIRSLISTKDYFFRIDAYNSSGITQGIGIDSVLAIIDTTEILVNPYIRHEAENYDQQSGVQPESCTDALGGENIAYIENDDWIKINNIDFESGAASFEARVASETSGGTIEIYRDSLGGKLIGRLEVTNTGGWQVWMSKSCTVDAISGVHDIFIKFTGGSGFLFNMNWWKFEQKTTGLDKKKVDPQLRIIKDKNGRSWLNGAHDGDLFNIYDLSGKIVCRSQATGSQQLLPALQLGIYIINVKSQNKTVSIKTVL